jgi:transcriptional regulator with XRE-family HTH domain
MPRRYGHTFPVCGCDLQRLASAIKRRGISHGDLARRAGTDPSTLSKLLGGKLAGSTMLPELYRALGLDPELIGKPDPDEAELLDAYRKVRELLPAKAPDFLELARHWAHEAAEIRQKLAEVEAATGRLKPGPSE